MYRHERGFSLIEIVVVMVVMALLVAVAVPTYVGFRERAQDRNAQAAVRHALLLEKAHRSDTGSYVGLAFQFGIGSAGIAALQQWDPSFRAYGWPDDLDAPLVYPDPATWDPVANLTSSVCITALSEAGSWFTIYQEGGSPTLFGEVSGFVACSAAIGSNPSFQTGSW